MKYIGTGEDKNSVFREIVKNEAIEHRIVSGTGLQHD